VVLVQLAKLCSDDAIRFWSPQCPASVQNHQLVKARGVSSSSSPNLATALGGPHRRLISPPASWLRQDPGPRPGSVWQPRNLVRCSWPGWGMRSLGRHQRRRYCRQPSAATPCIGPLSKRSRRSPGRGPLSAWSPAERRERDRVRLGTQPARAWTTARRPGPSYGRATGLRQWWLLFLRNPRPGLHKLLVNLEQPGPDPAPISMTPRIERRKALGEERTVTPGPLPAAVKTVSRLYSGPKRVGGVSAHWSIVQVQGDRHPGGSAWKP